MQKEIEKLASKLGTDIGKSEEKLVEFENIRKKLDFLDELTWKDNLISGGENHLWLVSSSDFNGDYVRYSSELDEFLSHVQARKPFSEKIRLGVMGVPPIIDDIYNVTEEFGARVVFNEVQRQFSIPDRKGGIVENYLAYTYPYDIFHRLNYILPEIRKRNIGGIIHYVQSFCHRHIEDLIVRNKIPLPVLTIEGEAPGKMDERTKIRLQAFIEMLQ
jgi:benzoyl-CoA reductase/2-hydroxyglutaryl-CoA dehydratase subunit BcrC/BadD/HgdB